MATTPTTPNPTERPLQFALHGLRALREQVDHDALTDILDDAITATSEALADSDEPRPYELSQDGELYLTIEARSLEEAMEAARDNVDRADYPDAYDSFLVSIAAQCKVTDEYEHDTVVLDEEAPPCTSDDGHDWQSPHELVGGDKSNPGVFGGPNGGITAVEVCTRCGCKQRYESRHQHHDGTTYERTTYECSAAR